MLLLRLFLLTCLCHHAAAQGSRTFRPGLLASVSIGYSQSSVGDLSRRDTPLGETGVRRFDFSTTGQTQLGAGTQFLHGLAYSRTMLDAGPSPLPEDLNELTLSLGLRRELSPTWTLSLFLRPGLYGDFETLNGRSFNMPVLLLASHRTTDHLTWFLGLNANTFSDNPVLPAVGLRWQFSEGWLLDVGYPRTSMMLELHEGTRVGLALSAQGGNYRITRSLGVPEAGIDRLANTILDYSEFRVGARWEQTFNAGLTFEVEAGAMIDREFDYFDRNYRIDGGSGIYGSLVLRGRF